MVEYRHEYYNRDVFPYFIAHAGNWDYYARSDGYCAAIPTVEAARGGSLATHMGDLRHVARVLDVDPACIAYELDCAITPTYHDGTRRRRWDALDEPERGTWRRNPTARAA